MTGPTVLLLVDDIQPTSKPLQQEIARPRTRTS